MTVCIVVQKSAACPHCFRHIAFASCPSEMLEFDSGCPSDIRKFDIRTGTNTEKHKDTQENKSPHDEFLAISLPQVKIRLCKTQRLSQPYLRLSLLMHVARHRPYL